MLKRERERERECGVRKATGSYRIYSIPGKTAALVPEFAVETCLRRTAAQVPALAVKYCPWREHYGDEQHTLETLHIKHL